MSLAHARRPWSLVAAPFVATLALLGATGTLAQGASITVEPAGPVSGGAATLTVGGSGFATTGNGVYVVFGPVTAAPEYYMDPGVYGAFKWVHAGAGDSPVEATLEADGSFSTTLDVSSVFMSSGGEVDCTVTACAVITFAAHGSPDRTQDTCAAVAFVDAVASPAAAGSPVASEAAAASAPAASAAVAASPDVATDACALIGASAP